MKLYFFIAITVLYTAHTHTAAWFCCSAQQKTKKPSAALLQKLGSLSAMVQWEPKRKLIRKEVLKGIHPDQISRYGKPLIFHAKNSEIIHALLNHNADTLVKDAISRETVLHACPSNPQLIVRYYQAGGDPCALDISGQTALHASIRDVCVCSICSKNKCLYQFLYESLQLLVYMGTPFDIKPCAGPYKDMPFAQVIESGIEDQNSRGAYIETIVAAAKKRKEATRDGASLTTDALGIVFAYDGQTTTELEKLDIYKTIIIAD